MECPHLTSITKINNPFIKEGLVITNFECSVCRSKQNTWMCIHCGILNCGRYANGHAIQHYRHKQQHSISIDCNALSIFCYICDDFVINEKCSKHFQKLRRILQENRKHGLISRRSESQKVHCAPIKKNQKLRCQLKASGLRNLGNTCFMNAVLQSLRNIQVFRINITKLPSLQNGLRNSLSKSLSNEDVLVTEEFRKTIISLWEGNKSVISPQNLFTVIWKIVPRFRGYQQQDAHEFLRYMLDRLHTELLIICPNNQQTSNAKNIFNALSPTIVTSIFGGILQNEVKCLICRTESKKHDPFFDLSLDIPQQYCKENSIESCTLSECLDKFTELEELGETELYNCSNCKKKQKSSKKFWIRRLPNVLCLHLKRFKWNDCFRSKLDLHVGFPIKDLDMSTFLLSNMPETRNNCGSPIYDLAAVIEHRGNGVKSGHYTSYALHEGYWHHFNDSSVSVCNEETVLNSKAYILFYIRRHILNLNIK